MKNSHVLLMILIFIAVSTSCGDDGTPSTEELCASGLNDIATSAAAWATSPANHTEANCISFKADLLKVLNNCNTEDYWTLYGGEAGWQEFVAEIEVLDCSLFP